MTDRETAARRETDRPQDSEITKPVGRSSPRSVTIEHEILTGSPGPALWSAACPGTVRVARRSWQRCEAGSSMCRNLSRQRREGRKPTARGRNPPHPSVRTRVCLRNKPRPLGGCRVRTPGLRLGGGDGFCCSISVCFGVFSISGNYFRKSGGGHTLLTMLQRLQQKATHNISIGILVRQKHEEASDRKTQVQVQAPLIL